MEMEMVQIKGVDSTDRKTKAELAAGAKLVVRERLMTHGSQYAISDYVVSLNGADASADVVSRSVAKDQSYQKFDSRIIGNAACSGHTECDAIIMGDARIFLIFFMSCLLSQLPRRPFPPAPDPSPRKAHRQRHTEPAWSRRPPLY